MLVLSGRDDELDKLNGFEVGADDYVVKPFSLPEISARLKALIRRGSPMPPQERFEFGPLVIDTSAAAATLDGQALELRPKEFALLAFLASTPGRCFSRDELLEHVWGSTSGWQQAATVTEHVHRLRTRLRGRSPARLDRDRAGRGLPVRTRPRPAEPRPPTARQPGLDARAGIRVDSGPARYKSGFGTGCHLSPGPPNCRQPEVVQATP